MIYKPTADDTAWASTTVRVTKDQGIIAIPSMALALRVDHTNKTLTRVAGPADHPDLDKLRATFATQKYTIRMETL